MIWESHFWKDDILKQAERLEKRKLQKRWPETSFAKLEQTVMLGFYSVRKLHEAAKLSTATMEKQLVLPAYSWTGKNVTKLNWHRLDELYDLENPNNVSKNILFVCHQFVHSFLFTPCFDDANNLDAILFASDCQRHDALLRISIDQIIETFQTIGNDYPNSSTYTLNPKTGDYDVVSEMKTGPITM